jgi:hypothetical protein
MTTRERERRWKPLPSDEVKIMTETHRPHAIVIVQIWSLVVC